MIQRRPPRRTRKAQPGQSIVSARVAPTVKAAVVTWAPRLDVIPSELVAYAVERWLDSIKANGRTWAKAKMAEWLTARRPTADEDEETRAYFARLRAEFAQIGTEE